MNNLEPRAKIGDVVVARKVIFKDSSGQDVYGSPFQVKITKGYMINNEYWEYVSSSSFPIRYVETQKSVSNYDDNNKYTFSKQMIDREEILDKDILKNLTTNTTYHEER